MQDHGDDEETAPLRVRVGASISSHFGVREEGKCFLNSHPIMYSRVGRIPAYSVRLGSV